MFSLQSSKNASKNEFGSDRDCFTVESLLLLHTNLFDVLSV